MKTKMIFLAFCMTIMFCISACAGTTKNTSDEQRAVEKKAAEDEAEMADLLSNGDVTITISIEGKAL
ncbi:MAG: hypothetical protein K5900_06090 [Butyrivibrio sp.]|nr:hypothetical protein [Butyrivibrio sp.]